THYNNFTASCVLDCNATTTNPSGQIVSPNYPNTYPKSNLCTWTLTGTSNIYYVFSISDIDIEKNIGCTFDSLKIFNGTSEQDSQLVMFCKRDDTTTNIVVSSTNAMHLVFRTDDSVQYRGFSGVYRSFDYNSTITKPRYGYIASPDYPLNYP
ncbi:unnamed protein product, partial [Lymnaea stagnalis]